MREIKDWFHPHGKFTRDELVEGIKRAKEHLYQTTEDYYNVKRRLEEIMDNISHAKWRIRKGEYEDERKN